MPAAGLGVEIAIFGIGAKPSPSPSPTVEPSPTATPRPGNTEWLGGLWAKRYTSRSGVSIDLATAMSALKQAMVYGMQQDPSARATVGYDRASGRYDVCFNPGPSRCTFDIVVRTRDVPAPPTTFATRVGPHALGESVNRLRAEIAADAASDPHRFTLFTSAGGAILGLDKSDTDPPPALYDHGFQSWVTHYYVIRDGIVAAHGWMYGEN